MDDYKSLLKLHRNGQALSQCALLTSELGQYKSAISYFQQYLMLLGDNSAKACEVRLDLSEAYLADGQYALALAQFDKLLEAKPDDVNILLKKGQLLPVPGKPGEAILDCTHAIKVDAKSCPAYVLRALNYQLQHKTENAQADFDRAISLAPEDSSVLVRRGAYFASLKEFDRAYKDFAKAIALNPKDFNAYQQRAKAYLLAGNYAKSEQEYDALAHLPGFKPDPSYFLNRADFYLQTAKFEKSLVELKKARALDNLHESKYALKSCRLFWRAETILSSSCCMQQSPHCRTRKCGRDYQTWAIQLPCR